jgi:hypothetical protein
MFTRTRLTLTSTVLLVGAVTSACGGSGGGSGAPTDASEKEFCDTQTSLFTDLMGDMENPEPPSNDAMAKAVKDWAAKLEKIGTPEDIPDEARAGFESLVKQANDIDADDFSIDRLEELTEGGEEASKEAQAEATAFSDYLTKTCGDPLEGLNLPEMPEMPESTE